VSEKEDQQGEGLPHIPPVDPVDTALTATGLRGRSYELFYAGALSFLRRRYMKDLAAVDVAVTGIPLDLATTNRPGARFGPRAIREASTLLPWSRPYNWPMEVLDILSVVDYGDCSWDFDHERCSEAIEAHVATILRSGAAALCMGGDHFISYPVLRAHAAKHGPLSLIHFDAHTDTWRIGEARRMSHGTMFSYAADEGLVVPARSIQIGIRTVNDDLLGFQVRDATWVHRHGAAETIAEIKRIVGANKCYITFDVDCLDPAFAPGTGTPVCGGLSTGVALDILRGIAGINLVGMDVVEVAPTYDVGGITALAAATIAYSMLALYACRPGGPASGMVL
jgi:agmatinase